MTHELTFSIEFHTPFRIASGLAQSSVDSVVSMREPLPAASLKGVMRAAAADVIQADEALVAEVFGSQGKSAAWTWSSARASAGSWGVPSLRTRVNIDETAHTVLSDRIAVAQSLHPQQTASFRITLIRPVDDHRRQLHEKLLMLAASAVRAIGAERTRGLGWVTINSDQSIDLLSSLEQVRAP